jgi:hypothetical protein
MRITSVTRDIICSCWSEQEWMGLSLHRAGRPVANERDSLNFKGKSRGL